jgi:hypothetical protein
MVKYWRSYNIGRVEHDTTNSKIVFVLIVIIRSLYTWRWR